MKSIEAYSSGFKTATRSVPMIIVIYLTYLGIGLLLAIPFFSIFRSAAGNSLLPEALLGGFDATVIRELLASGGKGFAFYIKGLAPWIVAFFFLQVYLTGGIYYWIGNPRGKFRLAEFNRYCRKLFWRFLKLAAGFLVIHVIIAMILYLPYILITGSGSELTDKQLVNPLLLIGGVHLLILVFIFMLSDCVKSELFAQDTTKVLKMTGRCLKLTFRNFFSVYFLGVLLVIVPLLVIAGYYLVRSSVSAGSGGMILLVFLVQQLFILIRVFLRVWRLTSVYRFYIRTIL